MNEWKSDNGIWKWFEKIKHAIKMYYFGHEEQDMDKWKPRIPMKHEAAEDMKC